MPMKGIKIEMFTLRVGFTQERPQCRFVYREGVIISRIHDSLWEGSAIRLSLFLYTHAFFALPIVTTILLQWSRVAVMALVRFYYYFLFCHLWDDLTHEEKEVGNTPLGSQPFQYSFSFFFLIFLYSLTFLFLSLSFIEICIKAHVLQGRRTLLAFFKGFDFLYRLGKLIRMEGGTFFLFIFFIFASFLVFCVYQGDNDMWALSLTQILILPFLFSCFLLFAVVLCPPLVEIKL
ncbi:hypothetical protein MOQ_009698 [Trypanosoma cruzi marinkellei]|uniref:Uncharacterized protein n=1 Tax=Trypanosoma cruzi marinkellei TaxID=85056 RepID=K2MLS7_TRYCR|nr:hypothetical protein MOQ_009698 [Trypanosoma cruzi marinkellei]